MLVGAFGTIPALESLLNNNGADSFTKNFLFSYGGAGQSALSSIKRRWSALLGRFRRWDLF
ncbi:MAG: hypothetical protein ACK5CA_09340 [Cyanobacteriota bacterium]